MKTDRTNVLVIGATGALGRPVVRERGVAVRAACRHPDQAADLAALGAEVVACDLTDAATLAQACNGVQRVLAAAHGLLGRGRWRSERVDDAGHRTLIAAAKVAGVQRFVYTSAFGAGPGHPIDFFRTKHAIEQALAASGPDTSSCAPPPPSLSFVSKLLHRNTRTQPPGHRGAGRWRPHSPRQPGRPAAR